MNKAFSLNDINDFTEMCSCGEIRPNNLIEERNLSGSRITKKPFIKHAVNLCNNNDTNLLDLLTKIEDGLNYKMINLGDTNPIFRQKVNNVIDEWSSDIKYDDLFNVPTKNSFNYDNILRCNEMILDLNGGMDNLEGLLRKNDSSIYRNIQGLQNKCVTCNDEINSCHENIDFMDEIYTPKHQNILLDLAMKDKSYYMDNEAMGDLELLSYKNSYNNIPDTLPDIMMNMILISNMILKECQYVRSVLNKFKMNIVNKQKTLNNVSETTPHNEYQQLNPVSNFIYSLISNGSDSDEEESEKKIVTPIESQLEKNRILVNKIQPVEKKSSKLISSPRDRIQFPVHKPVTEMAKPTPENKPKSSKKFTIKDKSNKTKSDDDLRMSIIKGVDYNEMSDEDMVDDSDLDAKLNDDLDNEEADENDDDLDDEEDDEDDEEEEDEDDEDDELDDDDDEDDELDDEDDENPKKSKLSGNANGYSLNFYD
jgi:hypothetical protein